jgi:hypothetical protein
MKTAWPLERERSFLFSGVILRRVDYREVERTKMLRPLHTNELCEEASVGEPTEQIALAGDLGYWTTTVRVALDCTDPEAPASPGAGVAVMVAVEVTDLVVVPLDVPPQPETKPRPAKRITSNASR